MDKFLSKFFGWMDSLMEKVNNVLTFDVGQELKKRSVKIAIVNVIVKLIYIYMRIKKFVIATTVNVNNYASIKTF